MLEISGSAMTAERQRAEIVTSNMANAQTTRSAHGGPYRRQLVVFRAQRQPAFPLLTLAMNGGRPGVAQGVRVSQVVADQKPGILRYQPGNPDADAKGYVAYPAIDPVEEMADLLGAVRAYELNASAVAATKGMIQQSLDILK
ncbi:MAG TPA: flagellar basal body rod protein FlgC [Terriglobales bacterium]|nr:flagellar basal body rod protein FlgC [Terriglobales bacterium]